MLTKAICVLSMWWNKIRSRVYSVIGHAGPTSGPVGKQVRVASVEDYMNYGKSLVQSLLCITALAFAGLFPMQAEAAVYNGDVAKTLGAGGTPSQNNIILVQRRGRGDGGGGGGRRSMGGGGGGGGRMIRGGGGGGGRAIRRGGGGGGSAMRMRRSSPRIIGGGGRNFRGSPVVRRNTIIRRGPSARRSVVVRRWGPRGRRYIRGGRWYFFAPWVGSYVYFSSYQACYYNCLDHGYNRYYCEDLCAWY